MLDGLQADELEADKALPGLQADELGSPSSKFPQATTRNALFGRSPQPRVLSHNTFSVSSPGEGYAESERHVDIKDKGATGPQAKTLKCTPVRKVSVCRACARFPLSKAHFLCVTLRSVAFLLEAEGISVCCVCADHWIVNHLHFESKLIPGAILKSRQFTWHSVKCEMFDPGDCLGVSSESGVKRLMLVII